MEITRRENKSNSDLFDYELRDGTKRLEIKLNVRGDLYWLMTDDEPYDYTNMTITKENASIYAIFDRLYSQIMNYDQKRAKCHYNMADEELFKNSIEHTMITSNGRVNWVSDEDTFTEGDYMTIVKTPEEEIIIEFFHQVTDMPFIYKPGMFDITFKGKGSRLDPFNKLFLEMYLEMQQYNPELHQVHIDELAYQKKHQK